MLIYFSSGFSLAISYDKIVKVNPDFSKTAPLFKDQKPETCHSLLYFEQNAQNNKNNVQPKSKGSCFISVRVAAGYSYISSDICTTMSTLVFIYN